MADEKKVSGKTRAGGAAKPFPWEEAIAEQYERSKSRLKGLATEPEAELQRILEQYLPKKSDSREERMQKLEDLAMGFAGTTIGKGVLPTAAREQGLQKFLEPSAVKERLYHGTNKDINKFDPNLIGANDFGWYGPGHYLTIDPSTASAYANYEKVLKSGKLPDAPAEGANVLPVHVQLRNPYYWPEGRPPARTKEESLAIGKELKSKGYDGVIVPNKYQSPEYAEQHEVVVFDPKRIKSSIGNRGSYDIQNPDITKAKGGAVKKAKGGSITDLPDEVTPSNWREHLQNNVLADARALIGVKDGGVINLDDLIEKSLKKKDGGVINLDELIEWTLAKDEHRKMKKGGAVKMADGGQTFPLQRPEEVTDLKPRPRTKRDELLEMLSKGVGSVHEFMAKPFGYENPPGEMLSSLIGIPGTAKTLERMAYGDPLTSGAGMTTNLLPETTEAAFLGLGAAPTAIKATKAAGKALAPTAKEMLDVQLQRMMSPYQMNVIKPEGGNWVRGSVENYLKGLKYYDEVDPIGIMNDADKAAEQAIINAQNNFVDKKLTRYVQNQMGTPSDPVRIQADAWQQNQKALLADKQKQIDKVRADIEKARRERNVDPEVLTRSQARLRELQKEKDFIQNRKGLHFEPGGGGQIAQEARSRRLLFNSPQGRVAESEVGKNWEDMSDLGVMQKSYMDQPQIGIAKTYAELKNAAEGTNIVDKATLDAVNRELEKMGGKYALENPEALAYGMSGRADYLGFNHLMDELDNALRPSQGLPEYLQLTPKTLDKMSVPQVVEHVDKINAWRASQKAEVDKARAANAATVVHKEYPEQGLKWVELKMPDVGDVVPEGWSAPVTKGNALQTKSVNGDVVLGESLPELIKNIYKRHPETPGNPRAALEDALKYEGEILQHCVGGYCPDVVEGRSRIFSLRDEDGRPHVTIEVTPSDDYDLQKAINWKTYLELQEKDPDAAVKYAAEVKASLPNRISQIKGLQNKKPEAEFMPYIQDFVKSGDWSHVGDIHHADLRQARDVFGPTEVETLRGRGRELGKYLTPVEIEELQATFKPTGMKRGGRITKSDLEREYRMAYGGGVFSNTASQDTDGIFNTDPDITDSGRVIAEKL